jgi:hypothetical protein
VSGCEGGEGKRTDRGTDAGAGKVMEEKFCGDPGALNDAEVSNYERARLARDGCGEVEVQGGVLGERAVGENRLERAHGTGDSLGVFPRQGALLLGIDETALEGAHEGVAEVSVGGAASGDDAEETCGVADEVVDFCVGGQTAGNLEGRRGEICVEGNGIDLYPEERDGAHAETNELEWRRFELRRDADGPGKLDASGLIGNSISIETNAGQQRVQPQSRECHPS